MEEDYAVAFSLIAHAGDARSSAMEAMRSARAGDFDTAREMLAAADEALATAHKAQTTLVQAEARGDKVKLNIILVHAQDHFMNAMTVREMAEEFLMVYSRLVELPVSSDAT